MRTPSTAGRSLRVRLLIAAGVIAVAWSTCLVVAGIGLITARHNSGAEQQTFRAAQTERDSYEGWLTDDDQSNMYVALAVLRDPAQKALAAATLAQIDSGGAAALAGLSQLAALAPSSTRAQIQAAQGDLATYGGFTTQMEQAIDSGNPVAAVRIMTVDNASASNRVQADYDQLAGALAARSATINRAVSQRVTEFLWVLMALAAAGLGGAGWVFWRLARAVTVPVSDMITVLEEVALGNLSVRATPSGIDELDHLAAGLNTAVSAQAETVSKLAANATTLAAAAEELSVTSTTLSDNASAAATQADTVSQSSQAVSSNVSTVAAAAEQLNANIQEITTSTAAAARVSAGAVERAEQTGAAIDKLANSSKEIEQVITLIAEITERTNLLALNALIEAARAGEAGRGFSVVAGEVRELAAQTASATTTISTVLGHIGTDVQDAIDAVAEITEIVGQMSTLQTVVAAAVEQQSATTAEIARNVHQAAAVSQEITSTAGHVAGTASITSNGAGDSAHAAAELSRIAADLQAQVDQFSL